MKKKIKLFDPVVGNDEKTAIQKSLLSRHWASGSGLGTVSRFEDKFRNYVHAKQCVAVNSGTAALHLALQMADIQNREVILPSMSFVSTANAILYNDGIPVFVDIEPKTLCLDPSKINSALTKKTKVILPVHFGGMPCKINELKNICKKNNLFLIEDAAHASGAEYNKKKIGGHGDFVCFSFHPVKNLAMPTGGAITINHKNSQRQKKMLESLRWCGISNRKNYTYEINQLGWNYYMNEFSAAIGLVQLKKLEKMNSIRKKIARRYSEEITIKEKMPFDENCSYHLYWIQITNRTKFMEIMKNNDIETGIHYKPIHQMKLYHVKKKLPITEKVGKKIISLPIHPNLTKSDITKIIRLTNTFANG